MNKRGLQPPTVFGANGQSARGARASPAKLPADCLSHLADALRKQCKRYRKRLKGCREEFSEAAVHDSRVETRRLLSLVKLLTPFLPAGRIRKVRRALKRHLDSFDDLRDAQVQLLAVGRLRRAFPVARSFYAFLLKRQRRFAKQARKNIARIRARRLGKLIADCGEEITRHRKGSAPRAAAARLFRAVDRAFARVWHLRARIDPQDTTTIHRARVAFKKFRYMIEALVDYLPPANRRYLATLHDYQTLMGVIQDAEVLVRSFDRYVEKKELDPAQASRFGEELLRRRQRLIRAYLERADRLFEFWPVAGRVKPERQARSPKHAPTGNNAVELKITEKTES